MNARRSIISVRLLLECELTSFCVACVEGRQSLAFSMRKGREQAATSSSVMELARRLCRCTAATCLKAHQEPFSDSLDSKHRTWISRMRYAYAVQCSAEPGGVTVTAPDIPELVTFGSTLEEALARAPDALVTALSFYTDDGRALPRPRCQGASTIAVPVLIAAKLALHEAMLNQRVSNVELGRRMGQSESAIRRLRDPLHRSIAHPGHADGDGGRA